MNVSNIFSWKNRGVAKRNNNPLLPSSVRGLIIGKGNCGKTTLLLNLLLQSDWLDYNHLYIFGKTLHQREYQILRKGLEIGLGKTQIANIFSNQSEFDKIGDDPLDVIEQYTGDRKGDIKAEFFDDCAMVPDPTELNARDKNLLILDDCFLGPQNKAEAYYTRGRHNNCDTFYISQSYFRLPRHTVRENSNFIILFPQDAKNLAHIYKDHCEGDMTMSEFKQFCRRVWSTAPNQFITIDLSGERGPNSGKYRENLSRFFTPPPRAHLLDVPIVKIEHQQFAELKYTRAYVYRFVEHDCIFPPFYGDEVLMYILVHSVCGLSRGPFEFPFVLREIKNSMVPNIFHGFTEHTEK